jgi:hypothetical protein
MDKDIVARILSARGYDDVAIGVIVYGKEYPSWHDYMQQLGHDKDMIAAVVKHGGTLEPEADQ